MRKQSCIILRSGQTLTSVDTAAESQHYSSILVLGGVSESVQFTLVTAGETLDLTLPGGTSLIINVESVTVLAATAAGGLLVMGFKQKNSLFGN